MSLISIDTHWIDRLHQSGSTEHEYPPPSKYQHLDDFCRRQHMASYLLCNLFTLLYAIVILWIYRFFCTKYFNWIYYIDFIIIKYPFFIVVFPLFLLKCYNSYTARQLFVHWKCRFFFSPRGTWAKKLWKQQKIKKKYWKICEKGK